MCANGVKLGFVGFVWKIQGYAKFQGRIRSDSFRFSDSFGFVPTCRILWGPGIMRFFCPLAVVGPNLNSVKVKVKACCRREPWCRREACLVIHRRADAKSMENRWSSSVVSFYLWSQTAPKRLGDGSARPARRTRCRCNPRTCVAPRAVRRRGASRR